MDNCERQRKIFHGTFFYMPALYVTEAILSRDTQLGLGFLPNNIRARVDNTTVLV